MLNVSDLPSPPLVGWSPLVVIVLLFFQEMGFALEGQADALDAGGDEADDDSNLCSAMSAPNTHGLRVWPLQ